MLKKNSIIIIILFSITLILACVFILIGKSQFKTIIGGGPTIEVTSMTRPNSSVGFSREKTRFCLKGIQVDRCIWVFDEKTILQGGPEIEYFFPFNEKAPPDEVDIHRVDVLYKSGQNYQSTYRMVKVNNSVFSAYLKWHDANLFLNSPCNFGSHWYLKSVSFVVFRNGTFTRGRTFPIRCDPAEISEETTRKSIPLTKISKDALAKLKRSSGITWIQYEFQNKTDREELMLIHPLRFL